MLPDARQPLSDWVLSPDDFSYLYDQKGNGANVVALSYSWFELLKDSPVDPDKPFGVCSSFYKRLSYALELPKMIKEFAELADQLLSGLRVEEGSMEKLSTPPLFRAFAKTPVFREFHSWVRTKDPRVFSYLLTFLCWGRKASYHNPDLVGPAVLAWVETEEHLSRLKLPEHVLEDMRRLVALSELHHDPRYLVPKHGPRQVAEQLDNLQPHSKERKFYKNWAVREFLSILQDAHGHTSAHRYMLPKMLHKVERFRSEFVAMLQFVPKDYKSVRSICMEMAVVMWMQQAVLSAIRIGLSRSKFSAVVELDDQSLNARASIRASVTRKYSTLDLSSASDLVSWALVRAIFPKAILRLLELTRSRFVHVGDDDLGQVIMEVHKFAPMGSAVNFPVQSIIFATVIALARFLHLKRLNIRDYLSEGCSVVTHFPDYGEDERVFGDDMIAATEYTDVVIVLLETLGFKVNVRKSFSGNQAIRESCGSYGLMGHEVAPLLFKVNNLETGEYDSWLGLISLANRARERGYDNLRNALVRLCPYGTYVEMDKDSQYANQSHVVIGEPVVILTDDRWDPDVGVIAGDRWNPSLCRMERRLLIARKPNTGKWKEVPITDMGEVDDPEVEDPVTPDGHRKYKGHRDYDAIPELERYHYSQFLNTKSGHGIVAPDDHMVLKVKSPPRDGLNAPVSVRWRWTPIG